MPTRATREPTGVAGAVALPLTGAQAGVWVAQQLDPSSPVFNTADAVELTGPVDAAALASEIRAVLLSADALHVRVVDGPSGPAQVLPALRDRRCDVVTLDLRGEADPSAAAQSWMDADLDRAIDLAAGPLFATALLRTGDAAWTWYLRIHHLATDAYATALLMRRIAERATARAGAPNQATVREPDLGHMDASPPAPKPLGTLTDLIDADASYRASEAYAADRAFWAGRLADHAAPPTLSAATQPPDGGQSDAAPAQPGRPRRASVTLDAATGAAIAAAGTTAGAGWPELVMAAFAVNLASVTGVRRQVLAMPVLARKGPSRRTPGMCVNVVPLAVEVNPEAPLAALVGAVRDELRALRPHHSFRFEEMQRMLAANTALFGPQVNLKPYTRQLQFGEAVGRIRNLATGPVDDLSLIVTDLPGGALELTLDGHAGRYDQATVDAQLARVVTTLEACSAAGAIDAPTGELPTLPVAEREQVIDGFNATSQPVPVATLASLLGAQAARTPQAVAVGDEHGSLTYAELHRRAEALADVLRAQLPSDTTGDGDIPIVGLCLERSVGLSVAVVATLLAGAAYLPLDPELPTERLAYLLADARPLAVVTTAQSAEVLPPHDAITVLLGDGGEVPVGRAPTPVVPSDSTTASGPAPTDAAYVLYTSGSTGRPKGVVVEHEAIVNRLAWMQAAMPIGPGDVVLQKTPYGFDVSVWELIWPLLHGARLVMARPGGHRDPAYLASVIEAEGVTTLHFVPSMLELFLEEPTVRGACTSLRQVICSGEALPAATVRRYHELLDAPLHNLYGPTEAAIDVTWWPCSASDPPGPVPIGRPVWNTRTYVLDDARRPVPVGSPGELWIGGVQLAREYLGRPDLTAERFLPDPFVGAAATPEAARMYRTGDLARWRPDGALAYLGRTDDQIKLRGQRIELGEIEATLARHPTVARAAVSLDRDGGPPRLVAHVVPAGGAPARPDRAGAALLAHAAAQLPEVMVPSAVAWIDALPLSPNGKLERRRLPTIPRDAGRPSSPRSGPGPAALPATPREQQLCELFGEALGGAPLAPTDDLFARGGDSLLAARLAARIRAQLGVELQLGAVFAAPTPSALAARIDAAHDLSATSPLLALRESDAQQAPLFCLHPAGGLGWCYAGLARTIADRPLLAVQAPTLSGGTLANTLQAQAERYADLIESRAPSGPLHLLGWSVGGVLAHATAGALQDRGRETGVIALLDAYPGEQWAAQPPPSQQEALLALLHMGGLGEPDLGGAAPTAEVVLSALAREGSALASLGASTFAAVAETVRGCSRLMREHRSRAIRGDLLFFAATAPRSEDWLDGAAWQGLVDGRISRHELPVTHPELPRRGPLDAIAGVVAQALEAYESGCRPSSTAAPASTHAASSITS